MNILAQGDASQIVGTIDSPLPTSFKTITGIIPFFTNIIRLVFVVAGIYAFINFILAGFQYMNAAGDSKALTAAWDKIWQSFLGLIVIVASFALAALMGQLLFGNPQFILNPVIYGPGQ